MGSLLNFRRFVSALHIPPWDPTQLISGGGDPMLKFWDWKTGQFSYELYIKEAVMPFVIVRRPKGKVRIEDGDEDGVDEGGEKRSSARQKRKAKKKKGKGKEREDNLDEDMEVINSDQIDNVTIVDDVNNGTSDGEEILVIQKLSTMVYNTDRLLLFTAVGSVFPPSFNTLRLIVD